MARFRKGTMDHDGDGRKGGSLKGDGDMVKVKGAGPKTKTVSKVAPKAKAEKAEAPKAEPPKSPPPDNAKPAKVSPEQLAAQVEQADLEESIGRHPGGMEPPLSEDAKQAALEAQFAEADAVGDPRRDEQAAILAVRGF